MTSSLFAPRENGFNPRTGDAANGWRLELLYLAAAGVELLWWLPWLLLIVPGAISVPGVQIALWAMTNVFSALLLTRGLMRRRIEDTWLRGAFLAGIALALWLTFKYVLPIETISNQPPAFSGGKLFFPSPVLTTLLILWFWYRGQTLGSSIITPSRAAFGFRIGIIALIGAALISDDRLQRTVLTVLPMFFFSGLTANSLARAASLRVSRDMQRSSFGLGWVTFISLIGAALSAVGFVGGIVLGGARFESFLGAIHAVFSAVVGIFALVLLPIAQWLAGLIDGFMRQIQGPIGRVTSLNSQFGSLGRNAGPPLATTKMLLNMAPFICGGGGLILILVIVLLLLLRRQSLRIDRNGEERETLDDPALLSSLLVAAQHALNNVLDALVGLSLGSSAANALTVRRLYARLCRLAAERGYARNAAQTPTEYRQVLRNAFPTFSAEIDQLTQAYVNAHYGETLDDPAVIPGARSLCEQIAALPMVR